LVGECLDQEDTFTSKALAKKATVISQSKTLLGKFVRCKKIMSKIVATVEMDDSLRMVKQIVDHTRFQIVAEHFNTLH